MITGRDACRSNDPASSTSAAGSGDGGTNAPAEASPSEKTWSNGKSTNVGPVGGSRLLLIASSTNTAPWLAEEAVRAVFTNGATNGTWSISCSDPIPHRIAG